MKGKVLEASFLNRELLEFHQMSLVFPFIAFIAVILAIPLARRLALRYGFVDKPTERKAHDHPTPPVGGLVIVPTFILASILSGAEAATQWPFWAGLSVITLFGALDDRYAIRPRWKFIAQFIAAGLIVFGGAQVASLGNLFGFGTVWLGFAHVPFSLIAAVLLINAVNLIDGLDGLAGGVVFAALFWLMVAAAQAGLPVPAQSMAIMMATVAGFLIYNLRNPWRRRASIFLGDAGSMALGLTLAWYALTLGHTEKVAPIAVAWVLALPIMDTCAQFARRVREGRHPFDADRNHFHHHFINAGVGAGRATALIIALSFMLGLLGVGGLVLGLPEWVLTFAWIAAILTHMAVSLRPERFRRLFAPLAGKQS